MSEVKIEMQLAGRTTFNSTFHRPWLDAEGRGWVSVDVPLPHERCPVRPVLTRSQWKELDDRVARAVFYRTPLVQMVREKCAIKSMKEMPKAVLEYEDQPNAVDTEKPKYVLRGMPLPFCHANFTVGDQATWVGVFSSEELAMAEACGRRLGETSERALLGIAGGILKESDYPDLGQIHGIFDAPGALVVESSDPTTDTPPWLPRHTKDKIAGMAASLRERKFGGPYLVVTGTGWDQYMDSDFDWGTDRRPGYYRPLKGSPEEALTREEGPPETLRQNIRRTVGGVLDVVRSDSLHGPEHSYKLAVVQLDASVVQIVDGLLPTVVQWDDAGTFKVVQIVWPRVKRDAHGNAGIAVAG